MTTDDKIRIGVLYGGPSAEHDVSRASAASMVRALTGGRYTPVPIGISHEREFLRLPEAEAATLLRRADGVRPIEDCLPVAGAPVRLVAEPGGSRALLTSRERPGEILDAVDVVFPLLHGPFGEDGQVQAMLDAVGVAYVGCGILGSAVGMDKIAMKRALIAEGVPVTPHVTIDECTWAGIDDPSELVAGLARPLFVKPANLGSSIGISRVTRDEDLAAAVDLALAYDCRVIVEQGVSGRELECSVLGGFSPQASPVGEVTVSGGWFDYHQKYFADTDPMIVPAPLPDHVTEQVRELSVRSFTAAGCWGLARVDFLYDEDAGQVYVNEINTMPGFTEYSMYPKVWAHAGLGYVAVVDRLVELAFERHASRLRRSAGRAPTTCPAPTTTCPAPTA